MILNSVDTSLKIDVEEGQENLLEEFNIEQVRDELDLIIAMDPGSTSCRTVILDNTTNPSLDVYVMPSACAYIPKGSPVKGVGKSLYEQMYSTISNHMVTIDTKLKERSVIRGAIQDNMLIGEESITNSDGKVNSELLYVNIIDSIMYSIIQKYNGRVPEKLRVTLAIALPPSNVDDEMNIENFLSNISSTFTWTHGVTGVSCELSITATEKLILTESDAYAKGYIFLEKGGNFPEVMISMSAGGSTLGEDFMVNGSARSALSTTLNTSGARVLEKLSGVIAKNKHIKEPKKKAMQKAIKTGKVRIGNKEIDVVDDIEIVLEETAREIYTALNKKIFDTQSEYGIADVNLFLMSGKAFRGGEYNVSILDYLADLIREQSPDAEIVYSDQEYIPKGLALLAYGVYGGVLPQTAKWI